jgi:hypothetical protein
MSVGTAQSNASRRFPAIGSMMFQIVKGEGEKQKPLEEIGAKPQALLSL